MRNNHRYYHTGPSTPSRKELFGVHNQRSNASARGSVLCSYLEKVIISGVYNLKVSCLRKECVISLVTLHAAPLSPTNSGPTPSIIRAADAECLDLHKTVSAVLVGEPYHRLPAIISQQSISIKDMLLRCNF